MTKDYRFSPEVCQRAIRMILENQNIYNLQWAAIFSIALRSTALPRHCVYGSVGRRPLLMRSMLLTASERQRLKELEKEVRKLRRSNDIAASGFSVFCPGGARPPLKK